MRIVAWNVNRNLEQKICDSDFCAVISDYDVIFLSECWIQPGTSLKCDWLNDEFEYKCFPRLKGKDGGLVLLYRKTLRSDAPCLNIGGTCQDDHHVCSGSYVSGLCSGGANRRCCSGNDAPCLNIGGTCQDDHQHCSGSFVSGLCSGDTHRRCCSTQSSSGSDAPCLNIGGTCQEDNLYCSGSYVTGLCSGGTNRRCCSGTDSGMCSNVKVYSRATWGAKSPTHVSTMRKPVGFFFVHHTEGNACRDFTSCAKQMRNIQNYHMATKGWSDIGYSFLVGEDGAVYEGRGWNHVGAHTKNYNSRGFGVAVMGNFMHRKPNNAALNATKDLMQCGIDKGYITSGYSLYGHRDVGTTDCPGDYLYNEIRTWSHYNTQKPQR
ncbi:peptidoglycan recognition protein 4-like isoform X2 [Ostrea edulis]|uniref:peptidoglycan recognition protein 4-like isoform X2 n=1 Tax=Ostrea edulis TaxID=37623 RepID=UPI0024AF4938|nr:peptidoglycan recognition protein 4-like isoform X2 [Ostrea edulis]